MTISTHLPVSTHRSQNTNNKKRGEISVTYFILHLEKQRHGETSRLPRKHKWAKFQCLGFCNKYPAKQSMLPAHKEEAIHPGTDSSLQEGFRIRKESEGEMWYSTGRQTRWKGRLKEMGELSVVHTGGTPPGLQWALAAEKRAELVWKAERRGKRAHTAVKAQWKQWKSSSWWGTIHTRRWKRERTPKENFLDQ